ncbi:unnamed protein product [Rhizophagus irregularis]|nr:unnamed protein product [Rhizophagus irregularis]
MVLQCPRCGKNDFKKTRDLTNHLNRKFKLPNPSPVIHVREKEGSKRGQATDLSIEDLANWLANPEIKNNPTIVNKKIPKTDAEWFDLMEESSSKQQKKTKVFQPIEEDSEAGPGPTTQAYRKGQRKNRKKETLALEIIDKRDDSEDDPRDDSEMIQRT